MLERPDFPLGRIGGYILNYVSVIYVIVTSAVHIYHCLHCDPYEWVADHA